MLPFPVLSTMEFIWHFPVLSRMEFMWVFCPVLSTMELILVRYFLQWSLFFRYFLQWNLYGTFSGTFYNGIYMAPALSWIIHVNIGTMFKRFQ